MLKVLKIALSDTLGRVCDDNGDPLLPLEQSVCRRIPSQETLPKTESGSSYYDKTHLRPYNRPYPGLHNLSCIEKP